MCFAAAVVAALGLARAGAQTIPIVDDAKPPGFEVASVKPGDPNATSMHIGAPPGRFIGTIILLDSVSTCTRQRGRERPFDGHQTQRAPLWRMFDGYDTSALG